MQFDNEIIEAAEHEGKVQRFPFGEFIEKPNQCGYFEQNGNWYTYVIDERNFVYLQDHLMGAQ